MADVIGYIAATLGTFLMLPQVVKCYRTKHVEDLAWGMVVLYLVQCAMWAYYGYLIDSGPVLYCNIIATGIAAIQMWMKLTYKSVQK